MQWLREEVLGQTNVTGQAIVEAHGVLFHHAEPLREEIRYFIHEFQDRRGDSDHNSLKSAVEEMKKGNAAMVASVTRTDSFLSPLPGHIKECVEELQGILPLEQATAEKREKRAADLEREYEEQKMLVEAEMAAMAEAIQTKFDEKSKEIEEQYRVSEEGEGAIQRRAERAKKHQEENVGWFAKRV